LLIINKKGRVVRGKKRVLVAALLLVVLLFGLSAASKGSIGFVNLGSWADYAGDGKGNYVPGLRGEFFFTPYLGVSGDVLVYETYKDENNKDVFINLYMIDAVLRGPFGIVEPYVGLGLLYLGVIAEGVSVTSDSLGFNVRGGVDVNILEWLSLGVEANYFVDDLKNLIDNPKDYFSVDGLKKSALIGVTIKYKFN
jgi:outer membrane protein W